MQLNGGMLAGRSECSYVWAENCCTNGCTREMGGLFTFGHCPPLGTGHQVQGDSSKGRPTSVVQLEVTLYDADYVGQFQQAGASMPSRECSCRQANTPDVPM